MPVRSRSHQLETISIKAFENLLPPHWVCRRKSDDYGVDLEVELFGDDGKATGLQFIVQLKATDNLIKERSVQMEVDRIEYLASFQHPGMVVRYCDANKSLHYAWVSNIIATHKKPTSNTFTLKFRPDEVWTDATPEAISRTLRVKRTLTNPLRLPIGLKVDMERTDANSLFNLNHAISRLVNLSSLMTFSDDPDRCLPVTVWLNDQQMALAIDVVASLQFSSPDSERAEIFNKLVYGLAFISGTLGMNAQNHELNRIVVQNKLVAQSRPISATVAVHALEHPELASEIASLNSLHEFQDLAYAEYIHSLLSKHTDPGKRSAAVTRFFSEAISSERSETAKSALHYSLANYHYNTQQYLLALKNYNIARKLNNEYLQRDYFLCELGGTLFFRKKYRAAASAYRAAYETAPAPKVAICVGDCLIYSGMFSEAKGYFERVGDDVDEFLKHEASLKSWLCDCLLSFEGTTGTEYLSNSNFWITELDKHNASHSFDAAVIACLMVAFLVEDEPSLWAQALLLSLQIRDFPLLGAVVTCSVFRTGYDAYTEFRDRLAAVGLRSDDLADIDGLVDELHKLREENRLKGVTMRIPSFDTTTNQSHD